MIKKVEFKTPNNEVLQETNLARLYDDMSEKIVKESEDFEEVHHPSSRCRSRSLKHRQSSIKRTLSVSCGLFSQLFTPTPATPTKRQVMSPT
ncbi:hypothetical protein TNCV_4648101 [Trichonephila clavipes]|uniref:Uncharacterized protein n=1 Tax=Trichonephila clavipes TaxID=2585209 RepID=A0A8X6T698_TRICX|nr:hypothetical protein TNCV_4648101 [Trichonephila clavipes]